MNIASITVIHARPSLTDFPMLGHSNVNSLTEKYGTHIPSRIGRVRFRECRGFLLGVLLTILVTIGGARDAVGAQTFPGFEQYATVREIPAPAGFRVLEAPAASARVLATGKAGDSVASLGHLDVGGDRYYMSDWSFRRWKNEGKNPNWVALNKRGGVAPEPGVLEVEAKLAPYQAWVFDAGAGKIGPIKNGNLSGLSAAIASSGLRERWIDVGKVGENRAVEPIDSSELLVMEIRPYRTGGDSGDNPKDFAELITLFSPSIRTATGIRVGDSYGKLTDIYTKIGYRRNAGHLDNGELSIGYEAALEDEGVDSSSGYAFYFKWNRAGAKSVEIPHRDIPRDLRISRICYFAGGARQGPNLFAGKCVQLLAKKRTVE